VIGFKALTSWSPPTVGMTMMSLRARASEVTDGRGLSGCAAWIILATCSAACTTTTPTPRVQTQGICVFIDRSWNRWGLICVSFEQMQSYSSVGSSKYLSCEALTDPTLVIQTPWATICAKFSYSKALHHWVSHPHESTPPRNQTPMRVLALKSTVSF